MAFDESERDDLLDRLVEEFAARLRRGERPALKEYADRFPELGQHYHKNVARGRTGILIAYLRSVARRKSWAKRDATRDAAFYEALLRAGLYEEVLHGLVTVNSDAIEKQTRSAAKTMWKFLTNESE